MRERARHEWKSIDRAGSARRYLGRGSDSRCRSSRRMCYCYENGKHILLSDADENLSHMLDLRRCHSKEEIIIAIFSSAINVP